MLPTEPWASPQDDSKQWDEVNFIQKKRQFVKAGAYAQFTLEPQGGTASPASQGEVRLQPGWRQQKGRGVFSQRAPSMAPSRSPKPLCVPCQEASTAILDFSAGCLCPPEGKVISYIATKGSKTEAKTQGHLHWKSGTSILILKRKEWAEKPN